MSNRKSIVSIVGIIVVIVVALFFFKPNSDRDYNEIITQLEKENLHLENENSRLDIYVLNSKKTADSLQLQIDQNHRIIQNLQYELTEKIKYISSMSDVELYQYFTDIRTDSTDHRK